MKALPCKGIHTFESLVDKYSLVSAYPERRAVNETYTGAFPQKYFLDEDCQRYCDTRLKFNKSVI